MPKQVGLSGTPVDHRPSQSIRDVDASKIQKQYRVWWNVLDMKFSIKLLYLKILLFNYRFLDLLNNIFLWIFTLLIFILNKSSGVVLPACFLYGIFFWT